MPAKKGVVVSPGKLAEEVEKAIDVDMTGIPPTQEQRQALYEEIIANMTAKQREFVVRFLDTRSIKDTAELIGIHPGTPHTWEARGINWRLAVNLMTYDHAMAATSMLEQGSVRAVQTLIDMLDHKDPKLKLQAATTLSNLAERAKNRKQELDVNVNFTVDYKKTLLKLVEGEEEALEAEFKEIDEE